MFHTKMPVVSTQGAIASAIVRTLLYGVGGSYVISAASLSAVTALSYVLAVAGSTLLAGAISGGGSGSTGAVRDEGVKTRVSPDPGNRLPILYGEQRMKGTVFMSELSPDRQTWATMVAIAEGTVDEIGETKWGDKLLTFDGDVNTGLRNVTNAQGVNVDGTLAESDDSYNDGRLKMRAYPNGGRCAEMEAFGDSAENAWTRDGLAPDRRCPFAYWYLELEYNSEHGVTSLGNINMEVKGRKVRRLLDDGTLTTDKFYSTNPAECIIDYLTDDVSGGRMSDQRLDLPSFVELRKFCDEDAEYTDLNGNMNQAKRYTCNGVINTNAAIDVNLQEMLICCQSVLSYTLGKFQIIINKDKDVTRSFTDDTIVGTVNVVDSGFDALNNEVIMHFTSKNNNWQEDQVDAVSPDSVRNDNEPDLSVELPLAFTNNSIEAQRLAHIDLNQWRQNIIITFSTFISALELQAGDIIDVTHETTGFDKKKFRILQIEEAGSGPGSPLGLKITALEYDENVYLINAPHEEDLAKNTNLPDPTIGVTISNIQTFAASTRDRTTGEANIQEQITWECSVPRYVAEYEIDYKQVIDSIYKTTFASSSEFTTLQNLDANTDYDVRIRAILDTGGKSDFVSATFTSGGLPMLEAPTGLTISEENVVISEATGVSTRVTATWSKPNVSYPVRYVFEYTQTSGAGLVLITGSVSTDETFVNVLPFPHGTFDFQVKAIDINEVSSVFTTVTDKAIVGLTDTPADVTNFNIASTGVQALLSWTVSPDIDVRAGGHVEIRYHSSATSSANWAGSQDLVSNVSGNATSVSVPLLRGTYLVKFIDSGGRESLNAAIVTNSFVGSNFRFVTELQEAPLFEGNKVGCEVSGSDLIITPGQTLMVYTFSHLADLGEVRSIIIEADAGADISAISNQVCNVADVCSLLNACGVQESAAFTLSISTTDVATATASESEWTPYVAFIPGTFTARGFRFILSLAVADTNTDVRIDTLSVHFDTVDITQRGRFSTLDSGDVTVTFDTPFWSGINNTGIPNIGTQIIGGSQGDEIVIVSVSNTDFVASVYNNGIRVIRTVNYTAIGE